MARAERLITVFGGSGFLGRQIVRRLAAEGARVRVAVRRPERASSVAQAAGAEQITPVYADVWDEATVAPALEGAEAVINTVGHYVARGRATFEAIHGQGARHVALAAARSGARRLVHISGIGADPASESPYVRARAMGERLVKEAFPGATILRPSVMFGPEDAFFNQLAAVARIMPVLPLFGRGAVRLQPVFVGDVAEAVARALADEATQGRTFELGGPGTYTYRELLELLLRHQGRRRLLMPVPYFAWELLAALMAPLPRRPISRDQITLMKRDNVVDPQALGFADLGITPRSVEEILPAYLSMREAAELHARMLFARGHRAGGAVGVSPMFAPQVPQLQCGRPGGEHLRWRLATRSRLGPGHWAEALAAPTAPSHISTNTSTALCPPDVRSSRP